MIARQSRSKTSNQKLTKIKINVGGNLEMSLNRDILSNEYIQVLTATLCFYFINKAALQGGFFYTCF